MKKKSPVMETIDDTAGSRDDFASASHSRPSSSNAPSTKHNSTENGLFRPRISQTQSLALSSEIASPRPASTTKSPSPAPSREPSPLKSSDRFGLGSAERKGSQARSGKCRVKFAPGVAGQGGSEAMLDNHGSIIFEESHGVDIALNAVSDLSNVKLYSKLIPLDEIATLPVFIKQPVAHASSEFVNQISSLRNLMKSSSLPLASLRQSASERHLSNLGPAKSEVPKYSSLSKIKSQNSTNSNLDEPTDRLQSQPNSRPSSASRPLRGPPELTSNGDGENRIEEECLPESDFSPRKLTELEELSPDVVYDRKLSAFDYERNNQLGELQEIRQELLISKLKVQKQEEKFSEFNHKIYGDNYRLTGVPERKFLMAADNSTLAKHTLIKLPGDELLRQAVGGSYTNSSDWEKVLKIPEIERTDSRWTNDWKSPNPLIRGVIHDRILEVDARKEPIILMPEDHVKSVSIIEPVKPQKRLSIVVSPSLVHFPLYMPDEIYSAPLTILNNSSSMLRIRCVPKSNNHLFYIFASGNLDVAPGMKTTFTIEFHPINLGAHEWGVTVEADNGNRVFIPVIAKRESPFLRLASSSGINPPKELVLNMGFVRGGGETVIMNYTLNNDGGEGRFVLLSDTLKSLIADEAKNDHDRRRKQGPMGSKPEEILWRYLLNSNVLSKLRDETLSLGPFVITPQVWELGGKSRQKVTIAYKPEAVIEEEGEGSECAFREDKFMIQVACDNCTILYIPVVGIAQRPKVTVTSVKTDSGMEHLEHKGVKKDVDVDVKIDFGEQNPTGSTIMHVAIVNQTDIALPFEWKIFDHPGIKNMDSITSTFLASLNSHPVFSISPSRGTFTPRQTITFSCSFSPQEFRLYDVLVDLLFPHKQIESNNYCRLRCTGRGEPFSLTMIPTSIRLARPIEMGESYETALTITNESVCPMTYNFHVEGIDSNLVDVQVVPSDGILYQNASSCLPVRLNGCFPGKFQGHIVGTLANGLGPSLRIPLAGVVKLRTQSVYFDADMIDFGLLHIKDYSAVEISLVNTSEVPLLWRVSALIRKQCGHMGEHCLQIEPSEGRLGPGEAEMIRVTFVPTWYQRLRGILRCSIVGAAGAIVDICGVEMRGEVQTPRLLMREDRLVLKDVYVGVPYVAKIYLKNVTMIPTSYNWSDFNRGNTEVVVQPREGILGGKEEMEFLLILTSADVGALADISIFCGVLGMVEFDSKLTLTIAASISGLSVGFELLETVSEQNMGRKSKHGHESTSSLVLEKVMPKPSLLGFSRSSSESFTQGEGPDLLSSDEMRKTVIKFWDSKTNIEKLEVKSMEIVLDFGDTCPIFATRTQILRITNRSAIAAKFKLKILGNPTPQDALLDEEVDDAMEKTKEVSQTGLLRKTIQPKGGFSSAQGSKFIEELQTLRSKIKKMEKLLSSGNGCAFHAVPGLGELLPYESVDVKITAYNNLVGTYEDVMVCDFENWGKATFDVKLGVRGMPLMFVGQSIIRADSQTGLDRTNFGPRVIVADATMEPKQRITSARTIPPPLTSLKRVQLENQSPRTVVLRWHEFMKSSAHKNESAEYTQEIMRFNNYVQSSTQSPFAISPAELKIKAYETATITIAFRSHKVGHYDSVLLSEVGYENDEGEVYFPACKERPPAVLSKNYLDDVRNRLDTVTKLLVHAKSVQPSLTCDGDEIRLKCPYEGGSWQGERVVELKNSTDNTLYFKVGSKGEGLIVTGNQDLKNGWFECKPSADAFITVRFEMIDAKTDLRLGKRLGGGTVDLLFYNGTRQAIPWTAEGMKGWEK